MTLPAAVRGEPRLEPGFPVDALRYSGTYSATGAIAITVGNIDRDPEPEILAPAASRGPLYAWNGDGTRVPGCRAGRPTGWPIPRSASSLGARSAFDVLAEATKRRGVGVGG